MTTCKHRPAIQMAAQALMHNRALRTYDAVYRWTCPDCGQAQRTTRLADTVYALRHAYGWEIETRIDPGNLAVYTLVKPGDMPGDESKGPHPRKLVGEGRLVTVSTPTGYTPYDGQPVPVEAIPDSDRVECAICGWKPRPDQIDNREVLLGGWVKGICKGCSSAKTPVYRVFRPTKVVA